MYANGVETSWIGLRDAINTFLTVTMGTFTLDFNDGQQTDGTAGAQACWTHTLTGVKYLLDSGPSDSASLGTWFGAAGEHFIMGNLLEETATPSTSDSIWEHAGSPYDPANGGTAAVTLGSSLRSEDYPSCTNVVFSSGVNYWFFGDTPAAGGEDYFNMVLEVRPGVFSHWVMGRKSGIPAEMVSPYGAYMGCTGPVSGSATTDYVKNSPMGSRANVNKTAEFLYFPEGTSNGQIECSNKMEWGSQSPATNWVMGLTGLSMGELSGPWVCGVDKLSGRTILGSVPMSIKHGTGQSNTYYPTSTSGTSADQRWVPVGNLPGFHKVTIDQYLAAEELVVSSDTYVVFPLARRGTAPGLLSHPFTSVGTLWTKPGGVLNGDSGVIRDGEITSGIEGCAYKKTV